MSRWVTQLRLLFRSLFQRKRVDQELDEELQYHLEREMQEALNSGTAPEEARFAARRAMGAIAKSMDESRDARRANFVDDFFRDLRYAGRSLRRNPGFAALAVLIMALGTGANTAVFSVVNAVLLKPLPYRDPDRIVTLRNRYTAGAADRGAVSIMEQISIPDLRDWQAQNSSFDAIAYYGSREVPVTAHAAAEYARGTMVGPGFFRVFAVEPVIGRLFNEEETKPDGSAAMISYRFWQSHFGGETDALGQVVRIFGQPMPIVGVLPPGFGYPNQTDLWVPARVRAEDLTSRLANNWSAVARLKPGVRLEQAQTEVATISGRLEQQYPDTNKGRTTLVTRVRDQLVGDVRLTLYLLLGAVSVVLLIACANTSTLLLGKATARTREVAMRAALGASRRRIVRQLITESALLALLSGAVGFLIAYGGSRALVAMAPEGLPRLGEVGIDRWVLAFTFCVSVLTSLLFGLVPALYASKVDLNEALKQSGSRSVMAGGMVRIRGVLVVAEIALAVALLAGAGLLVKSFVGLQNVALGYRPENVLVMRATVPGSIDSTVGREYFENLLPKVAGVPGVLSVGATMAPPGNVDSMGAYFIDALPAKPDWHSAPEVVLSIVAPGTFQALGIPLKNGRDFNDSDRAERPLVAVVNESLVRKSFPGRSPIGRTIICPFDSFKQMKIIGVVSDVRQRGPALEPMPECYMTYRQHLFNGNTLSIVARTAADPNTLEATLRRLARETSPDVPVKFTTMEATLSEGVAAHRFRTLLLGVFAGLAVCLAMSGVYGVMAFSVGQRSNEIGLRMALGATAGSVVRLMLQQGVLLAGVGLVLGLAAAAAGTRFLTSMLFEVQANDPEVYLGVALLLGVVTLVASYVPARRAAKIDPLRALRQE